MQAKTTIAGLSFSKPCQLDRSLMARTEAGWNCQACQQQVMDLRNLSPEEILALYQSRQGELCGVLPVPPLEVSLQAYAPPPKTPRFRALALGLLALTGLSFFAQPLQAQDTGMQPLTNATDSEQGGVVQGKVINSEHNSTISGAKIILEQKGLELVQMVTDEKGQFALRNLKPGKYTISMEYNQYFYSVAQTLEVKANEIKRLDIHTHRRENMIRPKMGIMVMPRVR